MTQTHSKMLTTRRRKKKAQKESDRFAKEAKKLGKAGPTPATANTGRATAP